MPPLNDTPETPLYGEPREFDRMGSDLPMPNSIHRDTRKVVWADFGGGIRVRWEQTEDQSFAPWRGEVWVHGQPRYMVERQRWNSVPVWTVKPAKRFSARWGGGVGPCGPASQIEGVHGSDPMIVAMQAVAAGVLAKRSRRTEA